MVIMTISESDFIVLVHKYHPIIRKVSCMYFHDKDDQEDLYQEIVYQLWRALPSFSSKSKISTWIYRVALNTAVSFFRKANRHPKTVEIDPDNHSFPYHDGFEKKEDIELLRKSVKKLSKIERAIVLLYFDDYSYEEIADIIGISKNNLAVKMHRIKEKLRKIML